MKISAICPIHRKEPLTDVLESYAYQTIKQDYEVIFIGTNPLANADVEKLVKDMAAARKLNWKFIAAPGLSNCQSRNLGARQAAGDVLLFVDGDCVLAPHVLQEHAKYVKPDHIGIGIINIDIAFNTDGTLTCRMPAFKNGAAGNYLPIGKISALQFTRDLFYSQALGLGWFHNRNVLTDYINVVTRNASVWRESFLKIGAFDEDFGFSEKSISRGWEDIELGLRAFKNSLSFVFVPTWTVHIGHKENLKDGGWHNVLMLSRKHPWFIKERPDWFEVRYGLEKVKAAL